MVKCSILHILIVFVTILEDLLFAFIEGGWSSFIYVLLDNGFYADLCSDSKNTGWLQNSSNSTLNGTFIEHFVPSNVSFSSDPLQLLQNKSNGLASSLVPDSTRNPTSKACKEQQQRLHLLYTISIALLELLTVLWGPIIYKFGVVGPKILSMILFCAGCLFLGFASPEVPLLLVPGITCVGVGGLGIVVINMKVSYLLPFGAGLYVAVLNGACDSSVITFRIVKLLHELGVPGIYPFIGLIILHIIISGSSLLLHKAFSKTGKQHSETIIVEHDKDIGGEKDPGLVKKSLLKLDAHTEPSIRNSLFSVIHISHEFWLTVQMLVFFLYLGTINNRLQNSFQDQVSYFTNVLAYIMTGGVITAFIPGLVAEWQIQLFKGSKNNKERRLMPNILPLATSSLLAVLLSLLSAIGSETVLYIEFIVLTIFRSFMYSAHMSFIVSAFPIKHTNIIYPLGLTLGGVFSMTQYAIFVWYNLSEEAQFQVQVFKTLLVALSLVHPVIVFLTARGILGSKLYCNPQRELPSVTDERTKCLKET